MNDFDTNIGKADLDPIKDTDGKDDFTEGIKYDSELKKAPPTKYDSVAEAFLIEDGFFKKIGSAITKTVAGRTTVGRVLGIGLDVATFVFPYGSKIDSIRKTTKTLLGLDQRKFKYQPNISIMNWILNRLKEKSTWRGLVTVATGFGVALNPHQSAAIITLGVAAVGAFEVFFKEPHSKDAKG